MDLIKIFADMFPRALLVGSLFNLLVFAIVGLFI